MMQCPVCKSINTKLLFHTDADIYKCNECTHYYSDINSIDNPELYNEDYYTVVHKNWFENPNIDLFRWIVNTIPKTIDSILDVGCGKGAFLRYVNSVRRDHVELVGLDFTDNTTDEDIDYIKGDIANVDINKKFGVVVTLAVIEHVNDPLDFSRRISKLCDDNGLIIVMTLNNDSLLYLVSRILYKLNIKTPVMRLYSAHHLQHFTIKSLDHALNSEGMIIKERYFHNAPLNAIDMPSKNCISKSIMKFGVSLIFILGKVFNKTYLQTVVAKKTQK